MARLTRKNIKVFAGNATNNGVFGSLQAENPVTTNNVEQIQSLPAWNTGWNSATMTSEKLPPLEEFQGIQYVTTYQQAYIMQEGLPEWAASVTYYKGSLVKEVTADGFKIYNSLTDDNTNNLLSDTTNWAKVMDSSDLYAFDNAVVHLAGAETITGNKTFSGNVKLTAQSGSPQSGLLISSDKTNYAISVQNTEVTKGTVPSEGVIFGVDFYGTKADNQQDRFGAIECIYDTNKSTSLAMVLYDATSAENSSYAKVQLFHNGTTGVTYAKAPASDVNDSIVTTVSKTKAANGYFQLGNGLIIQWGRVTASRVALTITLPKAFSSATSYSISAITNNGKAAFSTPQTATTFTLDASGGIDTTSLKWIAIGY